MMLVFLIAVHTLKRAKLKRIWIRDPALQIMQNFYLLVGHVSCSDDLWFKSYIQRRTLSRVLILIITSQLLKLMERFKILKN